MPLFETLSSLFSTSAMPSFSSAVQGEPQSSGNIVVNVRRRRHSNNTGGGAIAPSPARGGRRSNSRRNTGGVAAPGEGGRRGGRRSGGSKGPRAGGNSGGSLTRSERIRRAVNFANRNYECGDPSCSWKVEPGQFQNDYECAEFVSRSLAAGGYVPNLKPKSSPQSDYANYDYKGNDYALWNTDGLNDFLSASGWRKKSNDAANVKPGCVVIGNPGTGYFAHTCLGVGDGLVTCHNTARKEVPIGDEMVVSIDALWCPPKQ